MQSRSTSEMNIKQFNPDFKKELQKDLLKAYKNGTRILDMLLEYQRIYHLEVDDLKKLINKNLKEKMFEQEKGFKTVVSRKRKAVKPKKKNFSDIDLDN